MGTEGMMARIDALLAMAESLGERLNRIEDRLVKEAQREERMASEGKEVLTVADTAAILGISEGSVYRLTSKKQIPFYKKGRKVFFKKSEIDEWRLKRRVLTHEELEQEAATYTVLNASRAARRRK